MVHKISSQYRNMEKVQEIMIMEKDFTVRKR